jgi:hypothetical protein
MLDNEFEIKSFLVGLAFIEVGCLLYLLFS